MANKFAFIPVLDEGGVEHRINPYFIISAKPDYVAVKVNGEGDIFSPKTSLTYGNGKEIKTDSSVSEIEKAIFNSGYPMSFISLPWDERKPPNFDKLPENIKNHLMGDSIVNVEMISSFTRDNAGQTGPERTMIYFGNDFPTGTSLTVAQLYGKIEAIQGYGRQAMSETIQGVISQSLQPGGAIHRAMKK